MTNAAETDVGREPAREDLLAFRVFADAFNAPDFVAGEQVPPITLQDGAIQVGWWNASAVVDDWQQALYTRNIVDPQSDYLGRSNVAFVNQAIQDPTVLDRIGLPVLRAVLTFLVRAERHAEGGWFEPAFESGMAQTATQRLVEVGQNMAGQ